VCCEVEQNWITYISQLSNYIKHLDKKMTRLENLLLEFEEELSELQKNKTHSIEKIEYKFDQLKIETLEGTLNIGLMPNGESILEDFEVANKGITVPSATTDNDEELIKRMQHHLFQFIDEEGLHYLLELERTNNEVFDEKYREMILEDIKKQLPHRINENMKKIRQNNSELPHEQIEHAVVSTIKNEIVSGLQSFIQHRPKGDD
jgi:spore germination protein PC